MKSKNGWVSINVLIPPTQCAFLDRLAAADLSSRSVVVRKLIAERLEEEQHARKKAAR